MQPKNLKPATRERHRRQVMRVVRFLQAMAQSLGRNPTHAEFRRLAREYGVPMTWVNLAAPSYSGLLRVAGLVPIAPVTTALRFPTAQEREERRRIVLEKLSRLSAMLGRAPRISELALVGLSRRQVRNAFGDLTRALNALAGNAVELPAPDDAFILYLRQYADRYRDLPSYREIAEAGWTQEQVTSWGGLLHVANQIGLVVRRAA